MDVQAIRRAAETPTRAGPADVEAVAGDLCAAFVDDPVLSWIMRADARRDAARLRFFRVLMKEVWLPDGEVERPAAGGAAAVWIAQGKRGREPLLREVRGLPMLLNASGLARFGRLLRLRTTMDAHHPSTPHDYLFFLGVHPAAQGAGVGSRLLRARTQRLDAAGRAAFLETATERNVSLYRRHGFEVTAEYRPAADGPLIRAMWREPRR